MPSHKTSRRKKRGTPYTRGEVNKWIDATIHPLAKEFLGFWLLDGALHALVEQNPSESFEKFLRYNAPKVLDQLGKQLRKRRKRRT